MKSMQCQMVGHELEISKEIKVLGYWVDEQLTGEAHCTRAAGKATRAAGAVKRSSRYLPEADREFLVKTLSHPHLFYCQNSMFNPSRGAMDCLQKAYNRSARIVCRTERSAPARDRLGWPAWEDSRRERQSGFVERVFRTGEPKVLKERFPGPLQGDMVTRAIKRGELWEPPAAPGIYEKSFGVWAPRVYNDSLRVEQECSESSQI